MKSTRTMVAALILGALPLWAGCEPTTAQPAGGTPGAFPPTLTDTEYHDRSWTRTDCMVCHEKGVQEAPVLKHLSVPALAADAKCRTCHVQVAGSKPAP